MSSKKPQDHKKKSGPTSAKAWKSSRTGTIMDLELPSGNVCRVKRVDMPTLLASGAFPDSMMAMVTEKVESATGGETRAKPLDNMDAAALMKSPEKLDLLFSSVDKIVPLVVVEPKVLNHRIEENGVIRELSDEERQALEDEYEEGIVWTDEVDIQDKMHIFQFVVGGSRSVEGFRSGLQSAVADISAQ